MMKNKIAIYSGEIPSTTFIERLIDGLNNQNYSIYLFGKENKKTNYISKNIHKYTFYSKFSKLTVLIKYSILLTFFKNSDKQKLDGILANSNKLNNNSKAKFYPVLYHLPDVFHIQWAKKTEDWMWLKQFNVKIIVSLRGAHINYSPIADKKLAAMYKTNFPNVDAFHAVSNAIANEATKYDANFNKIKVIYSGLNNDKLIFKEKLVLNKPIKIISIGREHWIKGYNYAIDACKILNDRNVDFQYKIIGMENDEELIFQRNQLNLKNKVSFVNKMNFNEIIKEIYNSDILLLSSVQEGIANVVLEAMALGTLVISTNCGGINEVIVNNHNGFLIPTRNAESIANQIENCTKFNLQKYNTITLNAKKTIDIQHSENKMINDFNKLYISLLCE